MLRTRDRPAPNPFHRGAELPASKPRRGGAAGVGAWSGSHGRGRREIPLPVTGPGFDIRTNVSILSLSGPAAIGASGDGPAMRPFARRSRGAPGSTASHCGMKRPMDGVFQRTCGKSLARRQDLGRFEGWRRAACGVVRFTRRVAGGRARQPTTRRGGPARWKCMPHAFPSVFAPIRKTGGGRLAFSAPLGFHPI